MAVGQPAYDDALLTAEWAADLDFVADAYDPMRFGRLAVDVELAAFTGFLGLRARFEQARDVEPDVKTNARRIVVDHFGF